MKEEKNKTKQKQMLTDNHGWKFHSVLCFITTAHSNETVYT